jgi:hypothetical protein
MTTYKLAQRQGEQWGVIRDGMAFIPYAEGNTDYQAYLKWLEEGNTPEPADEPADV